MVLKFKSLIAFLIVFLSACTQVQEPGPDTQVIAIGDSVMAWNGRQGAAVPDVVQEITGLKTRNLSVSGAKFSNLNPEQVAEGYDVRAQYVPGDWEWVLFNGGANDLMGECGCKRCENTLDAMISERGTSGSMPAFLRPIAENGHKIMIMGYYNSSERPNAFDACGENFDRLAERQQRFADATPGAYYVDGRKVIDPSDRSHFFIDHVHPSRTGSRLLGELVAAGMISAR